MEAFINHLCLMNRRTDVNVCIRQYIQKSFIDEKVTKLSLVMFLNFAFKIHGLKDKFQVDHVFLPKRNQMSTGT